MEHAGNSATLVRPADYRRESRIIAAVAIAIVAGTVTAAALRGNEDKVQPLQNWQISAFHDLNDVDQAIYNALLVAGDELWYIHSDMLYFGNERQQASPWPSVYDLDESYLLPPFTRDVAWRQQGQVEWQQVASFSFEGSAVYFGYGGRLDNQSAYLLTLSHIHKGASYADGAKVWVHPDPDVAAPDTVTRDALILDGWKEVVPYSGAMEVERLKA